MATTVTFGNINSSYIPTLFAAVRVTAKTQWHRDARSTATPLKSILPISVSNYRCYDTSVTTIRRSGKRVAHCALYCIVVMIRAYLFHLSTHHRNMYYLCNMLTRSLTSTASPQALACVRSSTYFRKWGSRRAHNDYGCGRRAYYLRPSGGPQARMC